MTDNAGSLILAVYDERGVAEEDFEILRHEPLEHGFEIIDAVLVFKDHRGRVIMSKRPRRSRRRRGARAHSQRGSSYFHTGMHRRDVREFGGTLSSSAVALVAVGSGPGVHQVPAVLHSSDLVINQVSTRDLAFRGLLARKTSLG